MSRLERDIIGCLTLLGGITAVCFVAETILKLLGVA